MWSSKEDSLFVPAVEALEHVSKDKKETEEDLLSQREKEIIVCIAGITIYAIANGLVRMSEIYWSDLP